MQPRRIVPPKPPWGILLFQPVPRAGRLAIRAAGQLRNPWPAVGAGFRHLCAVGGLLGLFHLSRLLGHPRPLRKVLCDLLCELLTKPRFDVADWKRAQTRRCGPVSWGRLRGPWRFAPRLVICLRAKTGQAAVESVRR